MNREPGSPVDVVDILGVGFGPSNLALALAVQEHNERAPDSSRIRASFVEQQAAFGWHRGMLLDGATMQVSFLKDLVTMRDPTSPRSYLNYLQGQGRLADFAFRAGKGALGKEGARADAGLLPVEIMGPPALWLCADESNAYTGRRVVARDWDPDATLDQALAAAMQPRSDAPQIM